MAALKAAIIRLKKSTTKYKSPKERSNNTARIFLSGTIIFGNLFIEETPALLL